MLKPNTTILLCQLRNLRPRYYCSNESGPPPPSEIKNILTATVSQEISNRQKLFTTDPISPGSIFFLPNGTKIFNKLTQFMRLQQLNPKFGFQEVITPLIYKKSLWEKSGHWDNYQKDMFRVEGQDIQKETYGLKPMNCPGHCIMYAKNDHSYQELPLRFSDFSPLHRNEASGALTGLTRLRKFHQDDGHIFCTPEQVSQEILNCLKFIDLCYIKVFKLSKGYTINLSTRPKDHFIGDLPTWDHAEDVLKRILQDSGKSWNLNEGDGAFYGPKLDIMIKDHKGKEHQVATIQLDFNLPERFNLKYKAMDNTFKRPIMIHRAVFGSVERFLGLLIDQNLGKWPFWLNPYQAVIIPINTKETDQIQASRNLLNKLRGTEEIKDSNVDIAPIPMNSFHFNVDIDERAEPLGYRIKDAIIKNYSYLIIVGENEVSTKTFSIRSREDRKNIQHLTEDEIFNMFCQLEQTYK
ncbi:hypothetical protein NCAS_0A02740 [Naumovozyma castellii]|uniref:threonine--tRNA ligase n=1 Tax=Naumovozyma castellii TaxID=27288 RepID=G0V5U4_NAUCA|nr:hypothetical protein NCAS_0A02740 [Naumovozyma castellii CBS 4309]CCC66832.1 hypothetical protein NCAS_0A02740 [Naumovozyma castellii CBS 4309]